MFMIAGLVYILAGFFFILCGSGRIQDWNNIIDKSANDAVNEETNKP